MRDYVKLLDWLRSSQNACYIYGCDECPADCENHEGDIFKDAADAIEELVDAVPHWISVEERLPESGERVLIMFKPFEDDENISIGWLTKSGFDCYDDSVYFFRSVTHWMPLPEPPKEENKR